MYRNKNKKYIGINLLLCLIFMMSFVLSAVFSTEAYAVRCDSYSGTGKKACSWCNNQKEHPAANNWGQVCIQAYIWGYEHKLDNRCDKQYDAGNEAFRKKWCKGGVAQYKKENTTTPSDSGGADSDTETGDGADTAPVDAPEEQTKTEDGINIAGKDIVAGTVSLDDGDVAKIGLEKNTGEGIIGGILNAVYALSATIAVIVIIAAGIMYITSDGDATKTARAKTAIIYSAVGLVIIGSAFIITGIIQNIGA